MTRNKTLGDPDVEVHWRTLFDDDDEGWTAIRCLYAYLAPKTDEILYIGKAWGVTVRGRWNRAAKKNFWNDLESQRGIKLHRVLLGEIALFYEVRLTHELVADIESLLIQKTDPWGNIQSVKSRISRPGMVVRCKGEWPLRRKLFRDS